MSRPRKWRKVCSMPKGTLFVPFTNNTNYDIDLCTIMLQVDEYETLRLIDYEGLTQEETAKNMGIARTTVQQIYTSARKKMAQMLVENQALKINGGDFSICDGNQHNYGCGNCRRNNCYNNQITNIMEENNMIIAIPVDEKTNDINVCFSFGRAPFFMLYNSEDESVKFLDNSAAAASGGAGIKASQSLLDNGATALITQRCGENAAAVLDGNAKIYRAQNVSALENAKLLVAGKLNELKEIHAGFHGIK